MANLKISQLTNGNPAQAGDLVPIDRAGANFSLTAGSIAALSVGSVGKNLFLLPPFELTDNGYANNSLILAVHASQVAAIGNAFKLRFDAVAGGTITLQNSVIRRTLPGSFVWLDSTPITWGGSTTPTFAINTQNFSDAISLAVDGNHDYYLVVYVGSSAGAGFPRLSVAPATLGLFGCGYMPGDQTATADASTMQSPSAVLASLAQVVIAG